MTELEQSINSALDHRDGEEYFRELALDFYDQYVDHDYEAGELHNLTFFRMACGIRRCVERDKFSVPIPVDEGEAFVQGMKKAQKDFQDAIDYLKTHSSQDDRVLRMNW